MSDKSGGAKKRLNDIVSTTLDRAGLSWRQTATVKQSGWYWLSARGEAISRRQGLVPAEAVVWTLLGTAELLHVDVPWAGSGEVTIATDTTVVSAGTERAWYLGLPNTPAKWPFRPGYSGAGEVLAVGPDVTDLQVGDRVAGILPHQSVVTVPARNVHRVPEGVALADAALARLAVIAGYGVRQADIQPGERVAVLGMGLIGALALRLARAEGAGSTVALATSRRRENVALTGGAEAFVTVDDPDAVAAVGASVVIEATGNVAGLELAVAAAAPGARVILLGSPRGLTGPLPVAEIQRKGLRLIGAHINGLDREARTSTGDPAGDLNRAFLDGLAEGRLRVDDLCPVVVDPREAPSFYHHLATGEPLLGARFQWPRQEHVASALGRLGRFVAPPRIAVRGIDGDRPAPAVRSKVTTQLEGFANAVGNVRFGLIGCGEIAVQTAKALGAAPNTRVTCCFDTVTELAQDLAKTHGAAVAGSVDELLARDDVDAVIVSVPHHLHAPLSMAAMKAGKHVITEKPPASSLHDAVAMATTAAEAGVAFSVLLPQRFEPAVLLSRRLVARGLVGDVTGGFAAGWQDKPPSYMTSGFTGRTVSDWRSSKEKAGGGVLIMNASHTVDALRFVSGLEVDEVVAVMGALDAPAEVEDALATVLRLSNGAVVTLHAGAAIRGTTFNTMRLWGTDGHVEVDPEFKVFTRRAIDDLHVGRWQRLAELPPKSAARSLFVSDFASAVTEGRNPEVTVDDALVLQATIESIYRAAATGVAVRPRDVLKEAQR